MAKFYCPCCDYSSDSKQTFHKHLKSKKHIKNSESFDAEIDENGNFDIPVAEFPPVSCEDSNTKVLKNAKQSVTTNKVDSKQHTKPNKNTISSSKLKSNSKVNTKPSTKSNSKYHEVKPMTNVKYDKDLEFTDEEIEFLKNKFIKPMQTGPTQKDFDMFSNRDFEKLVNIVDNHDHTIDKTMRATSSLDEPIDNSKIVTEFLSHFEPEKLKINECMLCHNIFKTNVELYEHLSDGCKERDQCMDTDCMFSIMDELNDAREETCYLQTKLCYFDDGVNKLKVENEKKDVEIKILQTMMAGLMRKIDIIGGVVKREMNFDNLFFPPEGSHPIHFAPKVDKVFEANFRKMFSDHGFL